MDLAQFDIPIESLKVLLLNKDDAVKKQCLEYILLLSVEPKGSRTLLEKPEVLLELINLVDANSELGLSAVKALINIASTEEGATAIFDAHVENEWKSVCTLTLLKHTVDRDYKFAEYASNVLLNMTTWEPLALKVAKVFLSEINQLHLLFEAVHNKTFNHHCPNLSQYLCQLLGNLAQSIDFQKFLIFGDEGHSFCSILPLINIGETVLQKRGIASTIYNCLFSSENHMALLNSPYNVLSYLLYPLAGPEEFDEEEVDKMPIELQYLGSDKEREPDTEIRKLLLKSLLMLCDTKNGRVFLRNQQTYPLLREYHKWEKDPGLILSCENVVDILIRTEEEIGIEDFKSINVPDDLREKFEKMDAEYIQNPDTT